MSGVSVSNSAISALASVPIFTGFARAVAEGLADGQIWSFGSAQAFHALHGYGMSLIWGPGVAEAFAEISAHAREGAYRQKDEWLQIDPAWLHLDWERALAGERHERVNFRFDRDLFRARHNKACPPPGWSIEAMDEAAFRLSDVHVAPQAFWKSYAAFQAHGGGVCARRGDGEIGAVAFSATRFDDWLEIGIETRAAYRGQGLARAVAVAMIDKCLSAGLLPVWACRKQNAGSYCLAQSLGFVPVREVPFYRLARG